jgi:hypothetical protein
MSELKVLQAGPPLAQRQETVDCPELGGSVICRGLTASEAFAIGSLRGQALRRVREAQAEHAQRVQGLPAGAQAPEFEAPALDFAELKLYGQYLSHMLACGVITPSGLALYTAEQWEVVGQHHAGLLPRLQGVVERLSGMVVEDVEKNSTPTPS